MKTIIAICAIIIATAINQDYVVSKSTPICIVGVVAFLWDMVDYYINSDK
jgi:hypothetical protein